MTPSQALAPATGTTRHPARAGSLWPLWFAAGLLLCGAQVLWTLQAGFLTPVATDRWRTALVALSDAAAFRELFAVTFPPLLLSADMIVALLPGTGSVPVPLLVNVLVGGALAAAWASMLADGGYGRLTAGLAALLLVAHPTLQQAIAAGEGVPLAVLAMTLLTPAALRVRQGGEVNAMAVMGAALALILFSAASGAYLVLAMLPFLVALSPPVLVARSSGGVLLVLLFPVAFTLAGYLYTNWIFGGSVTAFAQGVDSAIRGASGNLGAYPWLMGWGRGAGGAFLAGSLMILVACPLLPFILWRVRNRQARLSLALLAGSVLAAIIIASLTHYLDHPGRLLPYLLPVAIVGAAAMRPGLLPSPLLLLLATLGLGGGWLSQSIAPSPNMTAWHRALSGQDVSSVAAQEDAAFGVLLRGLDDVAMDADMSGLVVPARGGAEGLVLTSTDRLKADILTRRLSTRYIALQDPQSPRGQRDRISRALPDLWRDGPPGGRLVAMRGPWRLWEQTERVDASFREGGQS
ncbi:hypothetical protein [Niveispirillum irakense]|uniref:hypothetical protein n=1 Tax=Niveispirillum irakense TaxID=34011 RepID=UPI0003F64B22|nr:hypothetical protein [Niveispirillum irakense]